MTHTTSNMIGESAELQNVLNSCNIIAATSATILILGESGTGKELIAESIHRNSNRNQRPLINVNCGALSETLVESELFGHKKGAFTGADTSRQGKLKTAHGGTLFLDEIGELPLSIQAKLLRFLESGECQTVGEETPEKLDVRVIAATNRDLAKCVEEGTFRQDLYFRLNVIPVNLPALRERSGDVKLLLAHFASKFANEYNLEKITYTKDALSCLVKYAWPGNIRELRNFTERMAVLLPGEAITSQNLPGEFLKPQTQVTTNITLPDSGINLSDIEVSLINQALSKTAGNKTRAARLLGLTRDTLLYRLKKYAVS